MKAIIRIFNSRGYFGYGDFEVEIKEPVYYLNGNLNKKKTIQNGFDVKTVLFQNGLKEKRGKSEYVKILSYWSN